MKIILPIDLKSLHMNIKNDNLKGHTPTVSTPIKQGKSVNIDLMQIFKLTENEINLVKYPEVEEVLLKNAKSIVKVEKAYCFSKFSVNGQRFDCDSMFCLFVKKEIDETKAQYGRVKLHYPMSLSFSVDSMLINNKNVLQALSDKINNYAFVVKSFDVDVETRILNFNIIMLGENGVPYSKVFLNSKGAGNKYISDFYERVDDYDIEILNLKKIFEDEVDTSNYSDYILKERDIALEEVVSYLKKENYKNINVLSKDFPYSLYDIEYEENDIKKYIIIGYSASSIRYFNLSKARIKFMHFTKDNLKFVMVNNVFKDKMLTIYNYEEILDMNREVSSMKFYEV